MTWQTDRLLRPPPGIDLIDEICISADQRERMQAAQPDKTQQMMQAMAMMMQQQTQMLALLAQLTNKEEASPAKEATAAPRKKP